MRNGRKVPQSGHYLVQMKLLIVKYETTTMIGKFCRLKKVGKNGPLSQCPIGLTSGFNTCHRENSPSHLQIRNDMLVKERGTAAEAPAVDFEHSLQPENFVS